MAQQTAINGTRYAWTNFSCEAATIDGGTYAPPKGVMQAFNWSAKQDAGEVEGNQVAPVGVTDGYGKGTGDFEMLLSESDDFDSALTGAGAVPLMSVFFTWVVQYSVNDIDVTTTVVEGIKITGLDQSGAKGSDPATAKYTFRCSKITKNGVVIFGDPSTP